MTLTYGFYNSVSGDRTYNAEQFAEFFDGIIGDGVLQGVGTAFNLTANNNTTVTIGTGRAWFNKTWSYNDADIVMEVPSPSSVNDRIDTLVLEVDTNVAVRANTLKFVLGTPSTSPVRPTLTNSAGVHQYPIGDIFRGRDVQTVKQSNITYRVGTSTCPFATNVLLDLETYDILSYKRSIVRGNHLGSNLTTAQKNAIRDGSFEGMYLGDYWTRNGVNWRIVDFDYWYMRQELIAGNGASSNKRITDHHVVIIPDQTSELYANIRPFTSTRSASNCGWWHTSAARNRCNQIVNSSKSIFGANGILTRVIPWTTTLATARYAMNVQYTSGQAAPPSEAMITGGRNFGLPSATMDGSQLALYRHSARNFWMGHDQGLVNGKPYYATWLMNQYTVENWTCAHEWTGVTAHNPSHAARGADHQIRPVFGITGL